MVVPSFLPYLPRGPQLPARVPHSQQFYQGASCALPGARARDQNLNLRSLRY